MMSDCLCVWKMRGEETDVTVPAGDDGQQLLLENQVDVMHLFVVPHPDYF